MSQAVSLTLKLLEVELVALTGRIAHLLEQNGIEAVDQENGEIAPASEAIASLWRTLHAIEDRLRNLREDPERLARRVTEES